jgi:hypothetical protein
MEEVMSGLDKRILDQLEGHWQKMLLLTIWKLSKEKEVEITTEDIQNFQKEYAAEGGAVLFTHGHKESIEYRVVSAKKLENLNAFIKQILKEVPDVSNYCGYFHGIAFIRMCHCKYTW